MSSEGTFLRGSPERSSTGSRLRRKDLNDVEEARQRALCAANLYHSATNSDGYIDDDQASKTSRGYFIAGHSVRDQGKRPTVETGPPQPGDIYYKQKLRSGFIDLRNSYNEKLKPRHITYSRALAAPVQSTPGSGYSSESSHGESGSVRRHHAYDVGPVHRNLAERRGLYRSNSSLELDQHDFIDYGRDPSEIGPLHRTYGSASSLDLISAAGGDSFFAMLQDYRNDNIDQRAPPPSGIQDVLRGRADLDGGHIFRTPLNASSHNTQTTSNRVHEDILTPNSTKAASKGGSPVEDDSPSGDGSQSPKLKSKSQKQKERKQRSKSVVNDSNQSSSGGAAGLFRKLRGKTEAGEASGKSGESTANDSTASRLSDEQLKRFKAVAHFDCQSIGVCYSYSEGRKQSVGILDKSALLKNVSTGASQASGRADDANSEETTDTGDGRSNDLLLSCPFFRNELGGEEERSICLNRRSAQKRVQQLLGNSEADFTSLVNSPSCNGMAVLDISPSPNNDISKGIVSHNGLIVEHVDHGASYYRDYFSGVDHQNFVGVDERLGPIAVSIRREKLDERERETLTGKVEGAGFCYQYRVIVRTSELATLRGSILEESIPSSSRFSATRGLPPKDVLEYAVPDLSLSSLKLTNSNPKTYEQIMKLDEQGITRNYKVGVLLCRAGQSSEEDMYNNEHSTPAFDEFLDCIGQRVRLGGFDKYRGGLDCKTDTTGSHSVYAQIHGSEIMFHVSTMLPFTTTNRQQLPRKRHIGNDIVTIIFQEPGAQAFTPLSVRSHFQHVFIIVRAHQPNTDHVKYSLAIARSKDVPAFGPLFAEGALFNKSPEFAQYLLTKVINAENAVHRSEKFIAMATRTRQEYLKDLALTCSTSTSLEAGSKMSKFSLGSGRRKEKPKVRSVPDLFTRAAVVWRIKTEDFGQSSQIDCYLAIGAEMMVLIDLHDKTVVLATSCKSVLGWSPNGESIRVYINHGECVVIKTTAEDIKEIIARLALVSTGTQTMELTLRRNSVGQLGFHVHNEGLVSDIERHGYAWEMGMRDNCRLVEVCKVAMATLTHDQLIDLLRTSMTVKVVVIPPHEDGTVRRAEKKPVTMRNLISFAGTPNGQAESHIHDNKAYPQSQVYPKNYQDVSSHTAHSKQPSHDSLASRSSGRGSEGHTSTHGSRHDLHRSGEMTESTDCMDVVGSKQNAGQGWSGKVTVYPAYSREQLKGSQPNLSPHVSIDHNDSSSQWLTQSSNSNPSLNDPHTDISSSYKNTPSAASKSAGGQSAEWRGHDYTPTQHGYHGNDSTSSLDRHTMKHSEETVRYPSSMTNLSQLNDTVSSHSSHVSSALTPSHDDRDNVVNSQARTRHEAFGGSRRAYRDGVTLVKEGLSSPYNTSPRTARRGQHTAPDEHTPARKTTATATSGGSGSSIQADLLRLINPDVSFNLGEEDDDVDKGRAFQLARTKSEEGMGALAGRHHHDDGLIRSSTPPTPPPRDDSKDRRISPKSMAGTLLRVRSTENRGSNKDLPLPESTSGLEWNTLVDTATKAIEKSQFNSSSTGQNIFSDLPSTSEHQEALSVSTRTVYPSGTAGDNDTAAHTGSSGVRETPRQTPRWQTADERIPLLEARVEALERQLIQERDERDAMEMEMQRLRQENIHLQEESNQAAEQLRKFSEWFFNTMDRHSS